MHHYSFHLEHLHPLPLGARVYLLGLLPLLRFRRQHRTCIKYLIPDRHILHLFLVLHVFRSVYYWPLLDNSRFLMRTLVQKSFYPFDGHHYFRCFGCDLGFLSSFLGVRCWFCYFVISHQYPTIHPTSPHIPSSSPLKPRSPLFPVIQREVDVYSCR